jgi:hypothetical protein
MKAAALCLALALAVTGCASAWYCERQGIGYTCQRVEVEPSGP